LGDLVIDKTTVEELAASKKFVTMNADRDETEHSMEMHLPYIYKMLSLHFKSEAEYPPLIPILVGGTSPDAERSYGEILAPYLADPTSVFVVSSDFCHWGLRFSYTYYLPASLSSAAASTGGYSLKRRDKNPTNPPIYESIARLDKMSMDAVEGGKHDEFVENIDTTGNTVCGRHPIGVIMAAIEAVKGQGKIDGEKAKFKFVRYERNEDVEDVSGSSVSYASAFAIM
jgi:MEMO1 family protein